MNIDEPQFQNPLQNQEDPWEDVPPLQKRRGRKRFLVPLGLTLMTVGVLVTVGIMLYLSSARLTDGPMPEAPITIAMTEQPYSEMIDKLIDDDTVGLSITASIFGSIELTSEINNKLSETVLPELNSESPLYGCTKFRLETDDQTNGVIPIVLDQSDPNGGAYDLLYVDTNLNNDLTDETPLKLTDERFSLFPIPATMLFAKEMIPKHAFEPLTLSLPENMTTSGKPDSVDLLPYSSAKNPTAGKHIYLYLAPTQSLRGEFAMNGKMYEVHQYFEPSSDLLLMDELIHIEPKERGLFSSRDSYDLKTGDYLPIGDSFIEIVNSKDRAELVIDPYRGELGDFSFQSDLANFSMENIQVINTDGQSITIDGKQVADGSFWLPEGDYNLLSAEGRIGTNKFSLHLNPLTLQEPSEDVDTNDESKATDITEEGTEDSSGDDKQSLIAIRADKPFEFPIGDDVLIQARLLDESDEEIDAPTVGQTVQIEPIFLVGPDHRYALSFTNLQNRPNIRMIASNGRPIEADTMEYG